MGFADLDTQVRYYIVSGAAAVVCIILAYAIIGAGIEHSAAVLAPVALFIFLATIIHTRIRDQRKTI